MAQNHIKSFDEFINEEEEVSTIDWELEKNDWLAYLEKFYEQVENYLKDYVLNGKIKTEYSKKEIYEEYIGKYEANVLNIYLKNHRLLLDPMGTNLIGAKGRVDLVGPNGSVRFVLVNKDTSVPTIKVNISIKDETKKTESKMVSKAKETKWEWKIATHPPKINYFNFTQEIFLDAILEVIGG